MGLRKSAIFRRIGRGEFPAPAPLGERVRRWSSDDAGSQAGWSRPRVRVKPRTKPCLSRRPSAKVVWDISDSLIRDLGEGGLHMNEVSAQEREIQWIPFDRLSLDHANPRLPERLRGEFQSEILEFLYKDGVLEELAHSYLDNGYFQHEPLIVVREDGEDLYTVVEGNRRLAALKILHAAPEAGDLRFLGIEPSVAQLAQLRDIPCFLISDRDRIHAFVGFKHIGGLKTWPSEAKARYILAEVHRLADNNVSDPFQELGRRVGSNAQGVRNSYLAIRILLHAREEFGLNVAYIQDQRFGVWLRCMNSADIRRYIGLGRARIYREIQQALQELDRDRLAEVLGDLTSQGGRSRAVLGDSRDVTTYGRVLTNERAHATLRKTGDLGLAGQVVDEIELEPHARRIVKTVEIFLETLHRAETADASHGLLQATEELLTLARSARAIVKDRMDDRDQDP